MNKTIFDIGTMVAIILKGIQRIGKSPEELTEKNKLDASDIYHWKDIIQYGDIDEYINQEDASRWFWFLASIYPFHMSETIDEVLNR